MPLKVTNTADNSTVHQNNYLAEDFNSPGLVEAAREVELPFGNGHLEHWYFDGIRMAYSNWQYRSIQSIDWSAALDVVTIYFSIKGKVTLNASQFGRPFVYSSGQYNAFYSDHFKGTFTNHELVQETFILQFTRNKFGELVTGYGDSIRSFLNAVQTGNTALLTEQNIYMDVVLQHAIRQVLNCNYKGGLKKTFLHAKALEIITGVVAGLERAQKKTHVVCKTDYDQERILFARDYLLQRMELPPSLTELSRAAGINEFKLKSGFKEMFNTTVFGYLAEHRLELARHDILEGKKTATEIAFELGYASPQHFSKAFKQKFGMSPKNYK